MSSLPSGGPPPATTPPTHPSGPPSLPPQNIPSQPPSTQNTLNRTRKRIAIIDPNTMKEVSVDGTSKSSSSPPSASEKSVTPEQSSASSTPGPAPEPEKPARPAGGVAAEFAAKVAAAAEGTTSSAKKDESLAPKLETAVISTAEEDTKDNTTEVTTVPVVEAAEPEPSSPIVPSSPPHSVSALNSSLSVTTDLKREEPLYEPVSPTPLPDSPMDETKVTEVAKPSPFEEVINKKAGVTLLGL